MGMVMERALFLVDGSNFYHQLKLVKMKKGALDFILLAQKLSQGRKIVGVRFYTAPVDPTLYPHDAAQQQRFFSHLRKGGIQIVLGSLDYRRRKCDHCGYIGSYRLEKGVDVNIAVDMVIGAIQNEYDVLYLLSCDADYIPAAKFVKNQGKIVLLAVPEGSKYGKLKKACNSAIPITQADIDACQAVNSP